MGPRHVRLEGAPRLTGLTAQRAGLHTVQMRLNVMLHLGLVLVPPLTDLALPDGAVPRPG